MSFFRGTLSNNEVWYLTTEKTLEEVKEYIYQNDWIRLTSRGLRLLNNSMVSSPKEVDIQTCNIVCVVKDKEFQKKIDLLKREKQEQMEIILNTVIEKCKYYNCKLKQVCGVITYA